MSPQINCQPRPNSGCINQPQPGPWQLCGGTGRVLSGRSSTKRIEDMTHHAREMFPRSGGRTIDRGCMVAYLRTLDDPSVSKIKSSRAEFRMDTARKRPTTQDYATLADDPRRSWNLRHHAHVHMSSLSVPFRSCRARQCSPPWTEGWPIEFSGGKGKEPKTTPSGERGAQ